MLMKDETVLRTELIWVCKKLEEKGLIAASDGNVSCRLGKDRLLITPSGKAKGDLKPLDLLTVDLRGNVLAGSGKPSSEIRMHLLVYQERPDVHAVVHAHPPMLTAFTLAGIPFLADALPEVLLTIGPVPTAPYATPTTEEVPASIAPLVADHNAMLLERHGSITFGRDLEEAYMRTEKLEHAAHTLFYAHQLNRKLPSPLSKAQKEKLFGLIG
jgi:L-fuculose-phosphate aldolase